MADTDKVPVAQGVHFVGSVPLSTTEDVFRSLAGSLHGRLKRIPDGETGERCNFVVWQMDISQEPKLSWAFMNPDKDTTALTTKEEEHAMFARVESRGLETRYDQVALESYEVFKRLRAEGIIAKGVRFQVCLPSVVTVVCCASRSQYHSRFEPIYEKALLHSLRHIQDSVPAEDLSIQWDTPVEISMIEKASPLAPFGEADPFKPWFEPVYEGLVGRLASLIDKVDEHVEVGMHLCYGDVGGKHWTEPQDTKIMADFARAVFDKAQRKVDWIHMPVPKSRSDLAYFEPLQALASKMRHDGTELCLGLVHSDDLDGTPERMKAASKFCPAFSVATECGMGRFGDVDQAKERLHNVLEICKRVSQ